MKDPSSRFANVDNTDDPGFFIRYLDEVQHLSALVQARADGFAALSLRAGDAAIDIGCGVGQITAQLARRVGVTGRVVGIDKSTVMVKESRRRHSGLAQASFEERLATDVEESAYHAAWIERVLMHAPEPEAIVVAAMKGLVRGGRLVLIEPDWGTLVVQGIDDGLQRLWQAHLVDKQMHGTAGRKLPSLIRGAAGELLDVRTYSWSFTDLTAFSRILSFDRTIASAVADGALSEPEKAAMLNSLRQADVNGTFFAMAIIVLAVGQRA